MLYRTTIIRPFLLFFFVATAPITLAAEDTYLKQLEMEANSIAIESTNSKTVIDNELIDVNKQRNDEVARMIESVKAKRKTPPELERALYEGESRSVLCIYCHGKDGNSVRPDIPNLAAQTPEYMLTQFQLFSSGARKNKTMQKLAQTLSFNDKVNIALFFSGMTVKPVQRAVNKPLYQKGEAVYNNRCAQCHGSKAHGNHQMPYLAGQKNGYLVYTLNLLRDGDNSRINSPMIPIAKKLTKDDILSVAEYLSVLN